MNRDSYVLPWNNYELFNCKTAYHSLLWHKTGTVKDITVHDLQTIH